MAETGATSGIDPIKQAIAESHAEGVSVNAMSENFNVHKRTLYRWLQEPEVRAIVDRMRSACLSAVSGRLHFRMRRCMSKLDKLIDHANPQISLAALKTAADIMLKIKAFEEFDLRLRNIESSLPANNASPKAMV